ncbi:protein-L-isoaspartate O-methyltransferase [Rhodobacterales bacterium 52_120_T64]|nr:protein-L-isoaspartate O-methyltransferase [Rhodobacterales bacterium 52_120_T64]
MIDFQAARIAMVDGQVRPSDVTLYPIIDAMLNVPREVYVPQEMRSLAYVGEHISLEDGGVVLAPRVLAKMLESLNIKPNELALDIGTGLGYSAAVIARLAEAVIAVEDSAVQAGIAETTLSEQSADNAVVHVGPLIDGAAEHGPYDVIVVEGGVQVLPDSLLAQLKIGGRIAAIFVNGPSGQCRVGVRTPTGISWDTVFDATAPILTGFARETNFSF